MSGAFFARAFVGGSPSFEGIVGECGLPDPADGGNNAQGIVGHLRRRRRRARP